MGLELVDLIAPGYGRPVVETLKLIFGAASEMQESSELCKSVYEQLVFLHDKLQAMERKRTLPKDEILRKYARLVGEYMAFLEKHKRKIWIYRIVLYKRVLTKVHDFQQDITTLMFALSMCHIDASADERIAAANERAAMAAFREQQTRFLAQQQHVIAMRLTDDATVAKEVAHEVQQAEALNVFRYELQAQTAGLSGGTAAGQLHRPRASGAQARSPVASSEDPDPNSKVLRTALDKVMRRSSVRVASVPDWFLPPHKVEFESQAFARGSFGTVHKGTMGVTDIAIKCLLADLTGSESVATRCRREAVLWYTFRHKHVLTMYGACDVSSPPFIVCERAAHGNLFNFLGNASNRSMTFRLLLEAASGLAYLHEQRVVHGDLKCDNILVADGYVAKLADFGFSYVLTASQRNAVGNSGGANTAAGALRWRAPESLEGCRPTFASDVFSLGMCIIEAVSQELPWGHFVDDDAVRSSVLSGKLPERPAQMSDPVWTLVKRMCSRVPADRPSLDCVIAELVELAMDQAATPTKLSASSPLPDMSALTINSVTIGPAAAARPSRTFPPATHTGTSQYWTAPSPRITSAVKSYEQPTRQTCVPSSPPKPPLTLEQAITQDGVNRVSSFLLTAASLERPVNGWDAPPLIVAAAAGATKVVQMLLTRGANVHAVATASPRLHGLGQSQCTALHVAAHFGHTSVIQELLRRGANSGVCNGNGDTALSIAARAGHVECVHALLQSYKVDVNAKNGDGATALHRAAASGHVAIVTALLSYGARVDDSDVTHKTPLHWCAELGQLECARVLLQHKADANARPRYGRPALHSAAERGHVVIIAELLRHGARVDEPDITNKTSLHAAAWSGKLESVQLLLQHRANVNAWNVENRTPLNYAAASGRVDIVHVLVAAGASVNHQDVDDAKRNGHREIAAFLQRRGPAFLTARYG